MTEHYFSADPSSTYQTTRVTARIWGHDLVFLSASGVFSHGRLDPGTAVLVREVRPPTVGATYLDLGCGYGVLACALATVLPEARVWAVDVNERALAVARGNAERLGIAERVSVVRPEQVPATVRFDGIWSNPPIRIGKAALRGLLMQWLPRLSDDGEALLVVGRNLGADSLHRWLVEQGYRCERVASAKGFRVLQVRAQHGSDQRGGGTYGPSLRT